METFLQLVARDLYAKIGNDLSRTAIVFPNKRASLFFNEYLATETDRPLWSPAYVSISELFRQLSPLKSGDPICLVCELYKVFREETHSEETLDDFYFWGELLISDFDDVDKNLVDAQTLPTLAHSCPAKSGEKCPASDTLPPARRADCRACKAQPPAGQCGDAESCAAIVP